MAKITGLNKLPGNTPAVPAGQSPDDWLKRVNDTITNFKDLANMAKDMKVQTQSQGTGKSESEIATLLQILIEFGYGDKPIGHLLQQISPFTVNQVLEVMKNAIRPKE